MPNNAPTLIGPRPICVKPKAAVLTWFGKKIAFEVPMERRN